MRRVRVIPVIMIDRGRAVVSRNFKSKIYVGDPINAIRIFNDKEVDEVFIVEVSRDARTVAPDFELIAKMASESFMPLTYGGYLRHIDYAERIITCGVEKISFNSALFSDPDMVHTLSDRYGKQSIVASIDYGRNWLGNYVVKTNHGTRTVKGPIEDHIRRVVGLGVGEVFLNSIERDGTFKGYDLAMIRFVSDLLKIPLVACGGAASIEDFRLAVEHGASAVAAGAMFFFKGGIESILINYPSQRTLTSELYDVLGQR